MAIERGSVTGTAQMVAEVIPAVNQNSQSLSYPAAFAVPPVFIASPQTTHENDAFTIRTSAATAAGISLYLQEEQSKDAETAHANEKIGYLALAEGQDLRDVEGNFVGETGGVSVGQNWVKVNLNNTFTKPTVILGGLPTADGQAATIRVRNVTASSF